MVITPELVGLAFLSVALIIAIALLFLQVGKTRQSTQDADQTLQQLQQSGHELVLAQQQQQHLQDETDRLRHELTEANGRWQAEHQQLMQATQQIAGLQASQEEFNRLRVQLNEREVALRELTAEHRSSLAKMDAEKRALEEKLTLLKDAKEQLNSEFRLLAQRIFEEKQQSFNQQSQQVLKASVDPLREQIDSFRKKVEDAYDKENAERNKLVGHILELQKQTSQIGQDAVNLTKALKGDNKAQGNWGEVILERLLEQSGLQKGVEYDIQVALQDEDGRRRNPDVIVRLPEGKDIVVDSKVSLLHYEQACAAEEETERRQALKLHVNSVRTHIQQLSGKSYDKLEGLRSLDFVFLFIPVEAAFMAAMQEEPGLFQEAYSKHIVVVSPTTLMATLRTVENIWRYEKQNRNAEEIARQAGGLYDQFALLLEAFEDIGKQLGKAQEAFELTRKRWSTGRGNLMRRVETLRQLGAKTKKQLPVSDDMLPELNDTSSGKDDADSDIAADETL